MSLVVSANVLVITTFLLQVWVRRYSVYASAFIRTILSWSGPAGQKFKSCCSPYFMLQVKNVGSDQLQRTCFPSVKKKKPRVIVYMYGIGATSTCA